MEEGDELLLFKHVSEGVATKVRSMFKRQPTAQGVISCRTKNSHHGRSQQQDAGPPPSSENFEKTQLALLAALQADSAMLATRSLLEEMSSRLHFKLIESQKERSELLLVDAKKATDLEERNRLLEEELSNITTKYGESERSRQLTEEKLSVTMFELELLKANNLKLEEMASNTTGLQQDLVKSETELKKWKKHLHKTCKSLKVSESKISEMVVELEKTSKALDEAQCRCEHLACSLNEKEMETENLKTTVETEKEHQKQLLEDIKEQFHIELNACKVMIENSKVEHHQEAQELEQALEEAIEEIDRGNTVISQLQTEKQMLYREVDRLHQQLSRSKEETAAEKELWELSVSALRGDLSNSQKKNEASVHLRKEVMATLDAVSMQLCDVSKELEFTQAAKKQAEELVWQNKKKQPPIMLSKSKSKIK